MLSEELLAQVKALDKEDKLVLFRTLQSDQDLAELAFDPIGLHANYEAANILMRMLEEEEAKTQVAAN